MAHTLLWYLSPTWVRQTGLGERDNINYVHFKMKEKFSIFASTLKKKTFEKPLNSIQTPKSLMSHISLEHTRACTINFFLPQLILDLNKLECLSP